ncbi:thioredoxin family protein [Alteromonas halophila]|uniref:Thioredoxin family protein n=1 Tax=Alteromonas halophila TaxID=516698 RepID=A0A918JJA8_9ALTE|nr:thioredoxin family protein [Alteromonas halophila]GGW83861.1 hypothetical protein GCM10007391_16830 [Alteromonas halophila]
MIKHRRVAFANLILMVTLALTARSATASDSGALRPSPYQPSDTVQQDITTMLATAKQNNQQAMIVLGASWCHDSMGLAERFSTPQMQRILNAHYQTLFVDVGFLQDRRSVTRRVGYPTYFATPTVLIVDPVTETLVNRHSIAKWGNAASVSQSDYERYFTHHANKEGEPLTDAQRSKLGPLFEFSDAQVARLHAGYAHLRPLLAAYENGNGDGPFIDVWKEVKGFRTQLQSDIRRLRTRLLAGEDVSFPDYGPFSWE